MEINFLIAVSSIQVVLKIWHMKNLTLEGKIIVFKALALSKIVHLCLTSFVPKEILLRKLKMYRKISFGTGQLRKLNIALYVILLQQVV